MAPRVFRFVGCDEFEANSYYITGASAEQAYAAGIAIALLQKDVSDIERMISVFWEGGTMSKSPEPKVEVEWSGDIFFTIKMDYELRHGEA